MVETPFIDMECQQNVQFVQYHWAQNCQDRSTHDDNTYILNEVVFH